jgi:hypothetical protein
MGRNGIFTRVFGGAEDDADAGVFGDKCPRSNCLSERLPLLSATKAAETVIVYIGVQQHFLHHWEETMSVFEKANEAIKSSNAQMFSDLLDDDFEFIRHQTGTSMNKSEMSAMIPDMMSNNVFNTDTHRKIYENDDILVEHYVMNFPDGTKEAIIGVNTLRNGKILRLETGATPIKD